MAIRIRTRILVTTLALLLLATVSISLWAVHAVKTSRHRELERYRQQEQQRIEHYRQQAMARTRARLKNFVDLAYATVAHNYTLAQEGRSEELQRVKQKLRNVVDIAYAVIERSYRDTRDPEYLQRYYGHRLQGVIDLAASIIREKVAAVEEGTLTAEEAREAAIETLRKARYNDVGYVWINDTGRPLPRMIMHPTMPELEGQVLDDPAFNCALGRNENLFRAFVDVCRTNGEGYVDYRWPKPTPDGLTEDREKLSYVRLIPEWDWIIGTGIYIDDAMAESQQHCIADLRRMRYDNGIGYFWINDIHRPLPHLIMHPVMPELEGQVLDDPAYNCALGRNENLFKAFVEVCRTNGEGYVDYLWPKPAAEQDTSEGGSDLVPKLSFVKLFRPWAWIIGSGAYMDNVMAKAMTDTLTALQHMSYDDGVGYFWVNDMSEPFPRMVMHPLFPELTGKQLDDPAYNCALGRNENLFKAFVEVCRTNGEGYVDYLWPKRTPEGLTALQPKLSYVRLFKPLDWVIGSGVYIDDINAVIAQRTADMQAEAQRKMAAMQQDVHRLVRLILVSAVIVFLLAFAVCLAATRSLAKPIEKLTRTMEQVRAQGLSRVKVDLQAMGNTREMQELGSIFNDMQDAVYKAVEDLRETTAAKERIESELSIARQIQTSLLQTIFPPLPARPEFELYAAMDPAKEVGGDFYDFFTADNGDFVFAVGDVSSKGVPASLFMAINMALLKVLVKQVGSAPAEVMNRLNDELASNNETCMFVTLFLGVVNPKTGEVRYASAGHNPPLFIHGNGDITYLEGSGDMVAGAMEGCTYREDRLTMRPGDVLLLYTDGVTEAMNAEQALYSPERLRSSVNRHCGKDPAEMIRDIRRDVDAFVGNAPQADDLTMMALRFRGNTT